MVRNLLIFMVIVSTLNVLGKDQPPSQLPQITVVGTRPRLPKKKVPSRIAVLKPKTTPQAVGKLLEDSGEGHWVLTGNPLFGSIELRGFSGRRALILEDGLRIDTQRSVGPEAVFVPIYDVKRVEVIKGALAVLYGSGAFGGAVNIVRDDPWRHRGLYGRVGSGFHSNGERAFVWGTGGYTTDRFFFKLHGGFDRAGDFSTGERTIPNSSYNAVKAGFWAGIRPTISHRLSFRLDALVGRDIGKPVTPQEDARKVYTTFPRDDAFTGRLDYLFSKDSTQVRITAFTTKAIRHLTLYAQPDIVKGRKEFESWQWGGFLQSSLRAQVHQLGMGLDLFGVTINMEKKKGGHTLTLIDGDHQVNLGLYGFDLVTPRKELSILGILRWDSTWTKAQETSTNNSALSGSLGVKVSVWKWLALRGAVGSAFRAPTIKESVSTFPTPIGTFCGNPDLNPERVYLFEGGLDVGSEELSLNINGFYGNARDLVVLKECTRPDCDYTYENFQRAVVSGVEAGVKGRLRPAPLHFLKGTVKLQYQYGRDPDTGGPVPMIPPLTIVARGSWTLKIPKKDLGIEVWAGYRYSGTQERIVPGMEVALWEKGPTPSFHLVSLGSSLTFRGFTREERFRLTLAVYNLLNTQYRDHLSAIPGLGRDIEISLSFDF